MCHPFCRPHSEVARGPGSKGAADRSGLFARSHHNYLPASHAEGTQYVHCSPSAVTIEVGERLVQQQKGLAVEKEANEGQSGRQKKLRRGPVGKLTNGEGSSVAADGCPLRFEGVAVEKEAFGLESHAGVVPAGDAGEEVAHAGFELLQIPAIDLRPELRKHLKPEPQDPLHAHHAA